MANNADMIGTTEIAARLGVSAERVRALIKTGRLPAQKLGRDWFAQEKDLELVKNRKPGRPRKNILTKRKSKRKKIKAGSTRDPNQIRN